LFRLGYNTNGLSHHRVADALELCASLGYEGVALTPDAGLLDPYAVDLDEVASLRAQAEDLGLELTLETGSRFLLDPLRKHRPTLLEDDPRDRGRRVDFLERCIDLAAELGAGVVSFWAGTPPEGPLHGVRGDDPRSPEADVLWERLVPGVEQLLLRARGQAIRLAFEPEPGMFVERPAGYDELVRLLGAVGGELGHCLDVGLCLCTGDLPVQDVIHRYADRLAQVHLDDVKDGVHEHRMFGSGDLDLPGVLHALIEVGYDGMAAVELSRDAHRGPEAAAEALERLRAALV